MMAGASALNPPSRPCDLPDHLEDRHRRFVNTEWAIGTVMSGIVPAVVITLFQARVPMPLLGSGSLASSLIMGTFLPGFGMPIVLTLVVRRRVRRGSAPGLGWPLRPPGLTRLVPGPLILRGVAAVAASMLILPPAGLLLMLAAGFETISATGFVVYNFFHGAALGALVLRPILISALADGGRWRPVSAAS